MAFRSPLTTLGEGIGQGLRDLAQTLIAQKQNQAAIEEQRARDERLAAETRRTQAFNLRLQQGQTAQQNAGAYLENLIAQRGNLEALRQRGVEVDPTQVASVDQLIAQLEGVQSSNPLRAPAALRGVQGIGSTLAGATGFVAGAGQQLQQRDQLQAANFESFQQASGQLLDPSMDLGTAQGMASFLANAERIRALSRADMPAGVDTAAMLSYVDRMETFINGNPELARLRDAQMAEAGAAVVIAGQAAAQAQLQTALLGMDVAMGQISIEEAQEALAGVKASNATEAFAFFQQTGLIPPGFESRVQGMYDQSVKNNPDAPNFEQFSNERFEAYRDRLSAEEELLRIEVNLGRDSVKLSEYAVDEAEYQRTYRDLDRFIAMQGNASELIGAALAQGDVAAIRRMINALDNPDVDPGMARFLREAGINASYLESALTNVQEVDAWNDRARAYSLREIDSKWAELDLQDATRNIVAGAEIRNMLASDMGEADIAAYWETLTPQQRAVLGGPAGLRTAQARARLRTTLENNELQSQALNFIAGLADLPIADADAGVIASQVNAHLVRAGVDEGTAMAIANGFAANWASGNRAEARLIAEHEAQLALWNAQATNYLRDPADPTSGVGVDDLLDILGDDRQILAERRQNLRTQAEQGGCIAVTGLAGVVSPAPNGLPPGFNTAAMSQEALDTLTPGQRNCARIQYELNGVDAQLVESSNALRQLIFRPETVATDGLNGGPGTGASHPLYGWDISLFDATQAATLMEAYDVNVANGSLDPNNESDVADFIMYVGQQLGVTGFATVPEEGAQGGGERPVRGEDIAWLGQAANDALNADPVGNWVNRFLMPPDMPPPPGGAGPSGGR